VWWPGLACLTQRPTVVPARVVRTRFGVRECSCGRGMARPAAALRRPPQDSIFTTQLTEVRRTHRTWRTWWRRASSTQRRGRRIPPARDSILMTAAGGEVDSSSGVTYTTGRGSRPHRYIKKGKRRAQCGGSLKGGDWRQCNHSAVALWPTRCSTGGSESCALLQGAPGPAHGEERVAE
jgi:hypothetical protein